MGFEKTNRKTQFDLSDLGYLDESRIPEMEMLCRLAAKSAMADVALLGIVDEPAGQIRIKGAYELGPGHLRSAKLTIATSLIAEARREKADVVSIASDDRTALPIELAVFHTSSFFASPVFGPAGEAIGALAIMSFKPVSWDADARKSVQDAASLASSKVLMRAALKTLKLLSAQPLDNTDAPVH